MARARLIRRRKRRYDDGMILEMVLWEVPAPVHGSRHRLKYSFFYGNENGRLIGYDNEAGKGDHRHYGDRQEAYVFTTPEQLFEDFLSDVRAVTPPDLKGIAMTDVQVDHRWHDGRRRRRSAGCLASCRRMSALRRSG